MPDTGNVPIQILQQGSVLNVASQGTIVVAAGGSIQNSGGMSFGGSVVVSGSLSVTGVAAAPAFTIGGTYGRWAFGTAALTSGLGTIATGLNRVISANAAGILGEAPNAGSVHWVLCDLSLSNAGSVIFRAGSANGQFTASATVAWQAFGT